MEAATKIAVLFFLSVGFTNGQDEGLLGLPADFDLFGPDFRNEDLYQEDIFKDDTYSENVNPYLEDTIKNLCNQFDLIIDNQRIDCKNIRLAPKSLDVNEHNIHKREAGDETQLEGSGTGEDEPTPEQPTNEEPAEEHIGEQTVEEESKANDTASSATEGEQDESPQEVKKEATGEEAVPSQPEEDPSANEKALVEVEAEPPKVESPAETDTTAEENPAAPTEINEEQPQAKENDTPVITEVIAQPNTISDSVGEENSEPTAQPAEEPATESPVVNELDAAVAGGVKKKGRVLKPTDFAEADKTNDSENAEADKGDTETLKEHQSGIAVFHSADKGTLEGTDDALNNMKPNEKLKQAEASDSQEQTGESTKEIQQGRKDTKVLVILFVAVVVVGGAAFAYNFIKKRKQKKAEATENGANNATPRNLQNLTSSAKSDPEQGTELKPLMKNAEQKPVVTEYKDEKENVKTEEVK